MAEQASGCCAPPRRPTATEQICWSCSCFSSRARRPVRMSQKRRLPSKCPDAMRPPSSATVSEWQLLAHLRAQKPAQSQLSMPYVSSVYCGTDLED